MKSEVLIVCVDEYKMALWGMLPNECCITEGLEMPYFLEDLLIGY